MGRYPKITVDLGNKLWMSDANFFKVQASTAWIRTYAENHRFITRAEIGYLNTPDIRKFHLHYVSLQGAIAACEVMAIRKFHRKIKMEISRRLSLSNR